MRKIILVLVLVLGLSVSAHAQWGNLMANIKDNPLMTQQKSIQDVIEKIKSITSMFTQMPLNSGKLEFIKAALPLLTQAKTLSAAKPDATQTSQMSGLLDQVKTMVAQKWSANPLTPAQIPEAKSQSQQLSSLLLSLLNNEGGALRSLIPGMQH